MPSSLEQFCYTVQSLIQPILLPLFQISQQFHEDDFAKTAQRCTCHPLITETPTHHKCFILVLSVLILHWNSGQKTGPWLHHLYLMLHLKDQAPPALFRQCYNLLHCLTRSMLEHCGTIELWHEPSCQYLSCTSLTFLTILDKQ